MTALVRGALTTAPLHVIRSHTAGTGKSYLVDVISAILTGRWCPVIDPGRNADELEKRIGSLLLSGAALVSLDNVVGELGGTALCHIGERPLVKIRILGRSDVPTIECKSTLFVTGNNVTLVGDLSRRSVQCTLDAAIERPELREFQGDPFEAVIKDRGRYIGAAFTVIRSYLAAGAPAVCGPLGSYADWCRMIRGPLIWLGAADPVDTMENIPQEDPEAAAIRELFAFWEKCLSLHSPYTARRIADVASERFTAGADPATTKICPTKSPSSATCSSEWSATAEI